jgi:hypothetical protein
MLGDTAFKAAVSFFCMFIANWISLRLSHRKDGSSRGVARNDNPADSTPRTGYLAWNEYRKGDGCEN